MIPEATVLPGPRAASRARRWFGHAAVLAALAILLALGTWQVERLHWKEAIVARIEARIAAPPVPVAEVERLQAETGDVDYVPATARGRFLHEGERAFLSTRGGQAGWNIYTPLLLDGGAEALFVNRGFVPYDRKEPGTRPGGQVAGETAVTGLARNERPAEAGWFLPENDSLKNVFFWADLAQMGEGLALPPGVRLLPFLLDAGPGEAPGGGPVGGATIVDIPNNHLQYAITWYGLAAVLVVMYGSFLWRGRRSAAPAPAP